MNTMVDQSIELCFFLKNLFEVLRIYFLSYCSIYINTLLLVKIRILKITYIKKLVFSPVEVFDP